MYEIAKNLPEKEFLVVGNTDLMGKKFYNLLINLPNVKSMKKTQNMIEVYKKTYLLVNPSKCYEGFGRTPVEAMVSGIPSVVSGFGGLIEVVRNSGDIIKDIFEVNQWVKAIKKYDDKKYYLKKSRLCKERLKFLTKENKKQSNQINKLIGKKKILVTSADLIPPRGGAERSLFSFLNHLENEVTIMTPHSKSLLESNGYKLIGIKKPFYFNFLKGFVKINFQNWWWHKVLIKTIKQNDFDMIFVQGTLVPSILDLPIKKIIFIRGAGQLAPNLNVANPKCKRNLSFLLKIQYLLIEYYRKKCFESINKADILISNSKFTRKLTKDYTKKNSLILFPEINIGDFK